MDKAVFLDRDVTINVDTGFTHKIHQFEKGAIQGLQLLQNSYYKLIIVTGQSGIGRGYYTEDDYFKFMQHMYLQLEKYDVKIDRDYFCPHHQEKAIGKYKVNCNCRKPKIGMLEQAAQDFDIDLPKSWVIGDKTDDIEMGIRACCKIILVKTGKAGQDKHFFVKPNYIAENLLEAAQIIQSNTQNDRN